MYSDRKTSVSPVQSLNALKPICITLSGIMMEVRLLQPSNDLVVISVTLLGILIDLSSLHLLNARKPISVTLSGIWTSVIVSRLPPCFFANSVTRLLDMTFVFSGIWIITAFPYHLS